MKKGLFSVILVAAGLVVGFVLGYCVKDLPDGEAQYPTVFYAEITEISDTSIYVEGLSVNDINGRGAKVFGTRSDEFRVTWRRTERTVEDLKAGQTVAIYHSGGVRETDPGQIEDVLMVQILDDNL